jgi:2-dehydropantoate 2-reductase
MAGSVLVYGAGVIGSIYAVHLAKAGYALCMLARGQRLQLLRSDGLVIRQIFLGEEERASATVMEELEPEARYDLILVAVRSGQVSAALRTLAAARVLGPVLVVGNNLDNPENQAALIGPKRLLLGFGAFGGYRDGNGIVYLDGRTRKQPEPKHIGRTTIGILTEEARPVLDQVRGILSDAGLPTTESRDIRAWLLCHAALVFPLAGAIYSTAGDQQRFCRTRDALVLGIRACRELFAALRSLGWRIEPSRLRRLLASPEWLLVPLLARRFAGEGARVAMFGHANAPGGRDEIGGQARMLDGIVRVSGQPLSAWNRLLPYFDNPTTQVPLRDGARELRLRLF